MISHPLSLAVAAMDAVGLLMILSAAATAVQVVLFWSPASTAAGQIRLEVKTESAFMLVPWAAGIYVMASLMLIGLVTNVLPHMVPGAMCGTGVMQATGGSGIRAMGFRLLVVVLLFFWVVLERLNHDRPDVPITALNARLLLISVPIIAIAALDTFRMFRDLDVQTPVDCCAAVYDLVDASGGLRAAGAIPDVWWLRGYCLLSPLLLAAGWRVWRRKNSPGSTCFFLMAGLAPAWVLAAYKSLIKILAAYYYGVLHHHCPWCLFLPEHRFIGFPLFAALLVVLLEGPGAYIVARVARRFPVLGPAADQRCRTAGRRLTMALMVFGALSGVPAILWRLRYGVWMG